MKKRKILIIDNYDGIMALLQGRLKEYALEEVKNSTSDELGTRVNDYDVLVIDFDKADNCVDSQTGKELTRYFKIDASNFERENFFDEGELSRIFREILRAKSRFVNQKGCEAAEKIEFIFPSSISVIHWIVDYLTERVEKMNLIDPKKSNLFVALDEALANAVKHGNKFDTKKLISLTAHISPEQADFVIEDEGEGFDATAVSDPTSKENIMKPGGRGILIMKNVMDEVTYNPKGNRLRMIKRQEK
ncbi:MAG: ATP-binding protein [Pyrinomonadaceae bacterium]|nr:ATP-binding protein [Pyrinomonadaceae bacterium]MCX7639890.1 ATP-binding protein [Pyrinomonadaceae bacterium]MDW8304062.1 ATP-binding protein [Acidobacteriota bacterium]